MQKVEMYYRDGCGYCERAEKILNKKNVSIIKYDTELDTKVLDEMMTRSGRDTVPQIFIGDKHIGGFDDLSELDMLDELDELLAD